MKSFVLILKICAGLLPVLILTLWLWPESDETIKIDDIFLTPPDTSGISSPNKAIKNSVISSDGKLVSVKDFISTSVTYDEESFSLTGGLEATQERFAISFYEPDDSFAISLTSEPLRDARFEAERFFLQTLGITQTAACSLNVSVGTMLTVNTFYAGQDLGFSFCPGSIEL